MKEIGQKGFVWDFYIEYNELKMIFSEIECEKKLEEYKRKNP
jgi:hypothetical protein